MKTTETDMFGSLFGDDREVQAQAAVPAVHTIPVYQMKLTGVEDMEWQTLFTGFDELHVITFSVGIPQVEKAMQLVRRGDMIIGSTSPIKQNLAELLAEQEFSLASVCSSAYLQSRVKDGTFRVYVANEQIHSKVYLLRSDAGRTRLILGSANFSTQAWASRQKEIYLCEDDSALFDHFMGLYEKLRRASSAEVSVKARPIDESGNNIEDLPLFKKMIQTDSAIVIAPAVGRDGPETSEGSGEGASGEALPALPGAADGYPVAKESGENPAPPDEQDLREMEYAFARNKKSDEWAERLAHTRLRPGSNGMILLRPKKIKEMKAYMKKAYEDKKDRMIINPEFVIDYVHHTVSFAGRDWSLQVDPESVKRDIECLYRYIDGCNAFTGDTEHLKTTYWKTLLYMFLSPFMARLRLEYSRYTPANSVGKYFPMYLLLRGPKNGGKSSLVRTGQHLMFGKALQNIPVKALASKTLDSYKAAIRGCPVLLDDVTNRRLSYLKEIVKSDEALINDRNIWHGTFLFTTNDGQVIDPSIAKRMVIFTIDSQLTEDESVKRDSTLNKLQNQMGNALYRAFLARMIPEIEDMTDYMSEGINQDEWYPDVFARGYEVLTEVIRSTGLSLHPSLAPFTWTDYMGDYTKGEKAIRAIREFYQEYPECFTIQKDKDRMRIDYSNIQDKALASSLQKLANELPVTLEPSIIGSVLFVKYSAIRLWTGLDFRNRGKLIQRITGMFGRS